MRFELTTLTLARLCSTPELHPHPWGLVIVIKRPHASKKWAGNKMRPKSDQALTASMTAAIT